MLAFYSYNGLSIRMKRYMYRFNSIPMSVLGRKSPNQMQREPETARFCGPRSGCALPPSVKPRSKKTNALLFLRAHILVKHTHKDGKRLKILLQESAICGIIYFKQIFARGRGPWAFHRGRFVPFAGRLRLRNRYADGRKRRFSVLSGITGENAREYASGEKWKSVMK